MLKDLFKKKKSDSNKMFSPELKNKIESSSLHLLTHELFMHYWTDNLVENHSNPEWQNQAIFFWRYDEPFEKQSLPGHYREFQRKPFIVKGILPENIAVGVGEVMPWFGMPGGGMKYFFQKGREAIRIEDIGKQLVYMEIIPLSDENSTILTERDNYYFLMDTRIIRFEKGLFYRDDKETRLSDAVESGEIKVIKLKTSCSST
jgi:hypothetical protein